MIKSEEEDEDEEEDEEDLELKKELLRDDVLDLEDAPPLNESFSSIDGIEKE